MLTTPKAVAATVAAAALLALAGQTVASAANPEDCIASGTGQDIQDALSGEGAVAELCASAVFELTTPIRFSAANQAIQTVGRPTGDTRAVLRVTGAGQATAIEGGGRSGIAVRSIQVDGNRPALGRIEGGSGLLEIGGDVTGLVVENNHFYEPRGWSALHLAEGVVRSGVPGCQGATVTGNQVGPSGTPDGWADGISLACGTSTVRNNTITDATDGAVVVFGAPGSQITDNTIVAQNRTLLGGINMVDYGPMDGNYEGTVVSRNTIRADGALVKIGLAMGPGVWSCTDTVVTGGTVTDNTLEGSTMGYGYAVNGVKDFTITGNTDRSTHVGIPNGTCDGTNPEPAGFLSDTVQGGTVQSDFQQTSLNFLLGISHQSASSPLPAEGDTIALRSRTTGKWVQADPNGKTALVATITSAGVWEKFDVEDAGEGLVALRAQANDSLVTAENSGAEPLIANRTALGPWEKFAVLRNDDGSVSLQADVDHEYVRVQSGTSRLLSDTTERGQAEKFDLLVS
ncbi:right-handed parallel beta-helix repeat-containing protein [Kineosporia sp. J2-2]|uniref:Right-handed parallel beta-helix repeat-containing protein n=1 Tax=Kineosporia corallincola TaxID=2835133 RepID=A0ABS5TJH4_9ACTN|nr:right-handed parallel beta-helix repeat-containing protein [Kineosporia corallincola]MBT0771237.1 right-handed parallel beta-helix repeat-containing protein [Kineosporia corallincola]